MGLFSLLFGASYLLFLDRVRDRTAHPIRLSAWRNTLLLVIGFAHAAFWVGDILMVYALCVPILMMAGASSWRGLVVTGLLVYYLAIGAAVDKPANRTTTFFGTQRATAGQQQRENPHPPARRRRLPAGSQTAHRYTAATLRR